jgi:large subunit ribosomal protein L15
MITKRKKNSRHRGSKTHGYGSMKKHRGQGHRGGRGNAGSGKRADSKKPTMLKIGRVFGKHGFISRSRNIVIAMNLRTIEEKSGSYLADGLAKSAGGIITINLADLGCDKLLCSGKVKNKYNITCNTATEKAIAAVKAAGGNVTVLKTPVEKPVKGKAAAKPAAAKSADSGSDD